MMFTYYRVGRWSAWLCAVCLIVGAVLFGPWLAEMEGAMEGLSPAEAAVVRFNHTYDGLARVFTFQLLFLAALWSFIPISRALRAHFGHNPAVVFMERAFLGTAIFGSVTQALDLAITAAAGKLVPQVTAAELPAVALTYTPLREGAALSIGAAFLLMGVGFVLAGRMALATEKFSRSWAYLTLLLAGVAALSFPAHILGLPALERASLLGVILGSAIWGVWLGFLLRALEHAPGEKSKSSPAAAAIGS